MSDKNYKPVWTEKLGIRSWDIGLNARIRVSSICSYFQEIATRHANHLDVGYNTMQESGKVWVLSKVFLNIKKLPRWGEEFIAETWPLGNDRIFFRRDYRLRTETEDYVNAVSYWLLIDIATRKPTIFQLDEEVIRTNRKNFSMTVPSISFAGVKTNPVDLHKVRFSDLDQNRHVNNARYAEWIFDLFEPSWLERKTPSFFSIEYKHEAKEGDSVSLSVQKNDEAGLSFDIEGTIEGSGQTCIRSSVKFT